MSLYVQTNQIIQLTNAAAPANTILAADTGKIMKIPVLTAATRVITLPALAAGLHYRFMVDVSAIAGLTQIARLTPAAGGTPVNGTLINANGVAAVTVQKNAAAVADFTATAVTGDYIDLYCDGVTWHVSGMSSVAAGLA